MSKRDTGYGNPAPKDGYITDVRLFVGRFVLVYKLYGKLHRETVNGPLNHEVRRVSRLSGFRWLNAYDAEQGVQILSYTNKRKTTWFVKRVVQERMRPHFEMARAKGW